MGDIAPWNKGLNFNINTESLYYTNFPIILINFDKQLLLSLYPTSELEGFAFGTIFELK
jgi:hypothetical protein